ncbi:phosphate ABC transporter permease PstA [Calothrix sp. FACHB-1219]|uniref:phosphate ABC transporter permease PstA n=1 Tax=unclassified Calothrix TaxID=2619626 RepID=UPI001684B3DB|nr:MULTISPECIES: phosphate ABC transporter permease PstA [unclassified Calothrix]MBD2203250.1 phosphate ABC transporter permease PstA [Calothrix sp. FACHB-168]MBD2216454.1 phosphate ABC transporter permease PstA [Calothrix sp. FACHB-1219]
MATTQNMRHIRAVINRNKLSEYIFGIVGLLSMLVGIITLFALIFDLFSDGLPRLSWEFFTSFPSRRAANAGILSAWVGSILVMLVTASAAIPIGIASGIYLEEYARKNWLADFIEINVTNLAGVPSIIYGLLALGLFVYGLNLGSSIVTAGLTLALLVLPVVIVTTRESLRAIPNSIREAAYATGASKWQMIWDHVLPYATGSILTGIIVALARAIGETAPLITIGALNFIAFLPDSPIKSEFPFISLAWLSSAFTVIPIQMFDWVSRPQEAFQANAAAAGIVLITMTLAMNAVAIYLRYRLRKTIKW